MIAKSFKIIFFSLKHTIIPNNILFCENLPQNIGIEILNSLFQQYPGFREVRLIPIKNVAFIEYEEEYQAGLALSGKFGEKKLVDVFFVL